MKMLISGFELNSFRTMCQSTGAAPQIQLKHSFKLFYTQQNLHFFQFLATKGLLIPDQTIYLNVNESGVGSH